MYTYIYTHTHIHTYIYTHTYTHIYIYIYIYNIYIHIYIYAYTYKNNLAYLKTMLIYVNFHKIKHIYIKKNYKDIDFKRPIYR